MAAVSSAGGYEAKGNCNSACSSEEEDEGEWELVNEAKGNCNSACGSEDGCELVRHMRCYTQPY